MPKYDYQWQDIASLPEAIEVYCQHIGMGYSRHRIDRLFNDWFPGIDKYTLSKLRKAAYNLLRSRSKKINKEDYIAQQIEFLQSIRSNPNEKTKSRLAANKDLMQLLALDAAAEGETAEETAAKIRAAISQMDTNQFSHVPPEARLKLQILQARQKLADLENEMALTEDDDEKSNSTPDASEVSSSSEHKGDADAEQTAEAEAFTADEQKRFRIMLAKQLGKDIKDLENETI